MKNKITVINGTGKLARGKKVEVTDDKGKVTTYSAEHIIVATGARAKELPNLPVDGKKIIEYRKAMSLEKQPKSMVVVGAGAIGVGGVVGVVGGLLLGNSGHRGRCLSH